MNRFAALLALGGVATLFSSAQAINYNSLKSNVSNLVVLAGSPTALTRYNSTGALINTIASVPGAMALTKVLGNYLVTTGSALVQVTPSGSVTNVTNAPSTAQWVSLAPDGLGNVVLADNKAHAVWKVNLQTNTPALVGNYPVTSSSELDDVGIAVDPSGNYLILTDNGNTLSMFSMTTTGTTTPVTLTGVAAKNTNGRLLRYNGGYAFVSYGDNTIDTITFTVPPGSSTPPVATIAVLSSNLAPSGTPFGLAANLDSGALYVVTSASTMLVSELKNNSSGTCAPNCLVDPIAFPTQPRDVIAESYAEIPYLAYGSIWTTGVYVLNTADVPASYAINFYNPDGSAAQVPFPGGSTSTLRGTLPPHGSSYVEASNNNASNTSTVSGLLSGDASISAQGLFRDSANGVFYEGSVAATLGGGAFSMPFDFTTFAPTGQQLFTGIAISNFSPSVASNVTCTATNQAGTVLPNAVMIPQIPAQGQFSGFAFSALYGLSGTLTCSSNTRLAAIGVRSLGSTFSTLPVMY